MARTLAPNEAGHHPQRLPAEPGILGGDCDCDNRGPEQGEEQERRPANARGDGETHRIHCRGRDVQLPQVFTVERGIVTTTRVFEIEERSLFLWR